MIVANFVTNRPTMGSTRTYEDFYKFLGAKPARLGIVSKMYPDLTASFLTESLGNIFHLDSKGGSKYKPIDAMYFEWEVESNNIKRVEFADVPTGTGENGSTITMAFKENYFQKYDIFKIDKTMQQCFVVSRPTRRYDNYWEVEVRLIDNDLKSVLDTDGCQIGDTCRFQSNAHPEAHQEGYVKYQSDISKHRNYITVHRCDDSYTAQYKALENTFVSIAKGEGNGKMKETLYKMDTVETNLLKNFMEVRAQGLLFNKTNVDPVTGKPTIYDPIDGRPIFIGDGIIPQIERFASKYIYNELTVDAFTTAIKMMAEKAESPTGNNWLFIVNEQLWFDIQRVLSEWLANHTACDTEIWSQKVNSMVKVGATFNSYEIAGNTISFKVDRALSREYGMSKGIGFMIDLTADKTSGTPAMQMFSLKGMDFIENRVLGVGGIDGRSSGVVSSPVAASKVIIHGYSGVGVFNPYRSFVLRQA